MDIKTKWELICKYLSVKEKASAKKVKFYKTKEMFQRSKTFDDLLVSMNETLNGLAKNISLFERNAKEVKGKIKELPKNIDHIILFDEYKNYPFLKDLEGWKVPFLFLRGSLENLEEILNVASKDAISIVGSRETPIAYEKWIEKRIPEKKIIVSGLANGADLIGHRVAMKKKMKIVVFPGYDISKNPSSKKMDVWDYALSNGLIISSVVPDEKTYIQADLIKRNYEMAKVVSASYTLYFELESGTMNHLEIIAEDNKKIFVPSNILRDVIRLLDNDQIKNNTEAA